MKVLSLFDGKYKLFEDGRIVSFARKKPIELVGKVTNGGYRMVILHDNEGRRLYKNVHRLIAEAFIPNPNGLPTVNHKDGNKLNNAVENLEWMSMRDNVLHCRDCLSPKSQKITKQDALEIRSLKSRGVPNSEISKRYGITNTEIYAIKNNQRWCF